MFRPGANHRLRRGLGALLALCCTCALALASTAAASESPAPVLSPLPSSDYAVHPACAPATLGRVSCQALELVPLVGEALAHRHPLGRAHTAPAAEPSAAEGDYGLTPADLHSAYGLPTQARSAQTIALVDAYNDPAAEEDLATYSSAFGLPACTSANRCFRQVNQRGETSNLPFPKTLAELQSARSAGGSRAAEAEEASEWGIEISLDIEMAHAVCESCHIVLVEATTTLNDDLEEAERSAEALGAQEVSNSWAGPEAGESEAAERESPFDHPGTVITASAGDSGYLSWDSSSSGSVEFPASSPHVVAVGGTRLSLTRAGSWASETVWNGDGAGGGGCSTVFKAPPWQKSLSNWSAVGCGGKRAVADVAADADPYTGVAVEDSASSACEFDYSGHVQHWCTLGGTSLASPVIAAVFALAGGAGGVDYPAATLYANAAVSPGSLHDVTEGSNGECPRAYSRGTGLSGCSTTQEATNCSSRAICLAGAGYDGPSGLGTPDGIADFEAPSTLGSIGGGSSPAEASEENSEVPSTEGPAGGPGAGATSGEGDPGTSDPSEGAAGDEPHAGETAEGTEVEVIDEAEAEEEGSSTECKLSALQLTPASIGTARASDARLRSLGLTFRASASSVVRVSLSRRRLVHGRTRWQKFERTHSLAVRPGRDARMVTLGGDLGAGTYRITLKPSRGRPDSLVFDIR